VLDLSFLPEGAQLVNVLTGEVLEPDASRHLALARALAQFPGALLAYGAASASQKTPKQKE